jgi:UDP-N-acetylmuramoyl-L-alanyl-D-glutamate--2,6-diaminopimelate ligase
LDYHKNIDDYLWAKSLLFSQLGNTYDGTGRKFAVINTDDPASELLKRSTAQHVISYGYKKNAQIMAENIKIEASGTSFQMKTPIGQIDIKSNLIGNFNVYNMLAASGAAITSNIPLSVIKEALESVKGVSGRFESVNEGQAFSVIVDYAHTPDSLENVLQTAQEFASNKVYVIVGCGGDRDRTKRPLMAEVALRFADYAIFTSDNPRTEDPQEILDDMTADINTTVKSYQVIQDRKKAIHHAVQIAEKGDIILIAGKGHETYQQIGHTKYDFDDREVARQAILEKG